MHGGRKSIMNRDLTKGNPASILILFTIPIFIGNVFQQFYSIVDTIIVGRFVGTNALAAVGSTGTICFLLLGFLMGFTAGVTVPTSQRFGAGDMDAMRKTVASALVLCSVGAVLMTGFSLVIMRGLMEMMQTPEDIFADAYSYIRIICVGIAAQVAYNLLSCLLRALGNSRVPLYFLILAALLNIALDLVFILCLGMGTAGAAWATVISQGVSALLCFFYIMRKVPELHLKREDWRLEKKLIRLQLGIGLPMAFQFSITAIGTTIMQAALNTLGSISVAAFTTACKIENIVTQAYVALGTAMSTYCAQNIGAGKIERIRRGFRSATVIGAIYSVLVGAALFFFGKYVTYLFVSENVSEILPKVETYLRCAALFLFALALVHIYRNAIQGMGYGLMPMMAGVAELVGRAAAALLAARYASYVGVCLSNPAAWTLAAILLVAVYFYVIRQQEILTEQR